jgi:uncharacterized protein YjbI with pentapeptide repeats
MQRLGRRLAAAGLFLAALALVPAIALGDIFRWDNGEVIPGTEGITPGPFVNLNYGAYETRQLRYADLAGYNLRGATFQESVLDFADFNSANLTAADFYFATLANANFTNAIVTGASFGRTTYRGFTAAQLYSTASYKASELTGLRINGNLAGWNFAGQNLAQADFQTDSFVPSDITESDFSGANLHRANLKSARLSGANLSRVNLASANLSSADLTNAKPQRSVCKGGKPVWHRHYTRTTVFDGQLSEQKSTCDQPGTK